MGLNTHAMRDPSPCDHSPNRSSVWPSLKWACEEILFLGSYVKFVLRL